MADDGEEKLISVARHIAKTLGHTDSMTDDILHIFSTFDRRISRDKLSSDMNHHPHHQHQHLPSTVVDPDSILRTIDHRLYPLISSETPIWSESAADAASFLSAVDDLLAAIREWLVVSEEDRSVTPYLDRAEDLLQQAMYRLESEFRSLLLDHPGGGGLDNEAVDYSDEDDDVDPDDDDDNDDELIPVARPLTDYNVLIDALPAGTISDLQEIAKRMVMSDYARECSHVYSACRREFLDESLSRLGLQQKSSITAQDDDSVPSWPDLEVEITHWTKASAVALRILFPSERRLCERIFAGFPSAIDLSFMEVCRGPTFHLLSFADAVATSARSPERLFRVLDVYETLGELIPEFDALFSNPYCAALRTESVAIWKRLGECIRGIFMELENLIRRDPAKQAMPGGGVHPITRYVMNYVRAACKSSRTALEQVFEDDSSANSMTSLSVQIAWIMELLESNLEMKSKLYRDNLGLSSVFMMNNRRYIVQKVRDSEELGELLGEDWIRKHILKVKQFYVNYQRTSWSKVLGVLKLDNNSSSSGGGGSPTSSMKERLKLFNGYFEETVKAQSTWVVFDEEVKQELKISVASNLSPAYRNFLARFQNSVVEGRSADRYVKYSVEQVEAKIRNELFQGSRK